MNRPYSEATVELVARAEFEADQTPEHLITWERALSFVRKAYLDRARVGLDKLAAAGLLLPEGVETRTEWTAPPEPGPEVAAVRDKHGRRWGRHAGLWCYTDDQLRHTHLYWHELFFSFPLTDVTPPDAVRSAR